MKKAVAIFLMTALMLSLIACGKGKGFEIPDVFGINYSDAVEVLEADGYEVKAIETSVDGIPEKLLYPLENVPKGTVFKVDDYIIDNSGNITKNYDIVYDEGLISEDKSIVIYYAKEDYVYKKVSDNLDVETTTSSEGSSSQQSSTTVSEEPSEKTDDTGIDADFKSAMDSYEKFMNDYVDFMKKYYANPSDLSLLADYADFMSDYTNYVEDFEAWEDEDLNSAELAYYIDVQTRVNKKLLEVTQ